jgi:hypothetical protein
MNQHSKLRGMCEILQIYLCLNVMIDEQVEELTSRGVFDTFSSGDF